MRVAIVHDWLTGMRGGERVLEALLAILPEAEIFTLVHHRGSVSPGIEDRPIHTSFLDSIPVVRGRFRTLLPLFPLAVSRFSFDGFGLVISSSHCVAKSVVVPPAVPHLCYCHTPMRYIRDQFDAYFGPGRASWPVRAAMRRLAPRLRAWDSATAARPTRFVANSQHVRERIRRYYGRDAAVVHPPVDVARFAPAAARGDHYLIVSALVPYKRVDLAIDAFGLIDRRLVIIGDGPDRRHLERRAGKRVEFAGALPDSRVAEFMASCKAFILPGEEDFGIAAVEAQASGAPVVALGRGGALETVVGVRAGEPARAGPTGVFFDEPTPQALAHAVLELERRSFDPHAAVLQAGRFTPDRFTDAMRAQIATLFD
ncbi:MAG: glycosyltransferase [Gemmatimonadetes bacterium]|nr:glycosyltransferase [Gemmatimonadota bacterium]